MAKPMFADHASCSASSSCLINTSASRRKRKTSSPVPSPPVLALLATISASFVSAEASPTPLSFLCPPFIPEPAPIGKRATRPPNPPTVIKKPLSPRSPPRYLPDKFEQGNNGQWRRVDTYTLYGSTVCLSCEEDATPTSEAVFDDQIQNSATTSVPISTASTSTPSYSMTLPPGWKSQDNSSTGRTTLILTLSLVLAFVICFFIISCIFWRKKKRRGRGQNDIEKKTRKRPRHSAVDDDGVSILMEREVKAKQKIWAKATARWKANAKYTARQRRGKRFGTVTRTSSPRNSCASFHSIEGTQTTTVQLPLSTSLATVSRNSSLESLYAATESAQMGEVARSPPEETQADDPQQASTSCPPSPPAYHGANLVRDFGGDEGLPIPELDSTFPGFNLHSSAFHNQNNVPYPMHAAHVATDDKRLLARMADLASAPPLDSTSSLDTTYHPSVPVWQDEELKDFGEVSHCHESAHRDLSPSDLPSFASSPAHLFPSPPSKGKMAAPAFYDYPYIFDDMSIEPDIGPSAPPFEEQPSQSSGLTPSAPPLTETEEAYLTDIYPRSWEGASESQLSAMDGQADPPDQNNTIPSHVNVPFGSRPPPLDNSNLIVQGPVASDGTPPCYYP